mmetsp:Transcript_48227/g.103289  ORF Transcript_48227/g.103289 Transcript_48227/m.103289 type:complete len:263 (-) Transcript_48227:141-929(-)
MTPLNIQSGTSYDSLWGNCSDPQPGVALDFSTSTFMSPGSPSRVKEEYKQKYQEVIFLLGLRDPVNRTVSNYYFTAHRHPDQWPVVNFPESVNTLLRQWSENPGAVWKQLSDMKRPRRDVLQSFPSFYYRHFRNWLDSGFLPSQMVVYPGEVYFKHRDDFDTNPVLQALRDRIGQSTFRLQHTWRNEKVWNPGPPKEIYGDDPSLVEAAKSRLENEIFAAENKKLFELLAEQVGKGMTLVDYTGKANDVEAVEKWMTSGWHY